MCNTGRLTVWLMTRLSCIIRLYKLGISRCYQNFKLQHLQELAAIYGDDLESVIFPSVHTLS